MNCTKKMNLCKIRAKKVLMVYKNESTVNQPHYHPAFLKSCVNMSLMDDRRKNRPFKLYIKAQIEVVERELK